MPRKAMPWFRCYVEMLHDRKIRRLKPEHRWLWIAVLAMARQSPKPGTLLVSEAEPADISDLADMAGLSTRATTSGINHMLDLGLIEKVDGALEVPKWQARQFESDNSTERVRAFRERK